MTFTCITTILKYTRRAVPPQLKLPDSQVSKCFNSSVAAGEVRGVIPNLRGCDGGGRSLAVAAAWAERESQAASLVATQPL